MAHFYFHRFLGEGVKQYLGLALSPHGERAFLKNVFRKDDLPCFACDVIPKGCSEQRLLFHLEINFSFPPEFVGLVFFIVN